MDLLLRKMVFFPDRSPAGPAPAGAVDVRLRASDGVELGAWHFPTGGDGGVHVLVANGNGGNRRDRLGLARALAAVGLPVLLFDYRGYGGNPGRPSEAGLARDVRAAREWLLGPGGGRAGRLLYLGESLGAAVVAGLAAEHPPAGLLLRSPFTALADVGRTHYPFLPVRLLVRSRFDVTTAVARVAVPAAVVYGDADRIVPPAQSRAVAAAFPPAAAVDVVVLPGADHNDRALCEGPELVRATRRLAERAAGRAP